MDGGPREKAMADEIKAMVKAKANERRERKWVQAINVEGEELMATSAMMAATANTADSVNGLSRSLAAGMALDSSDATDREMGGTSPETDPSSASSYSAGYDHHQQQQQKQQHYEPHRDPWLPASHATAANVTNHAEAFEQASATATVTDAHTEAAAAADYTGTGPSVPEAERSERELQFMMKVRHFRAFYSFFWHCSEAVNS